MKYYVVADPHGFYSKLVAALTEKGFFADKEPHKLVICGDVFDRGREAAELQAFLLDLMEKEELILVRGNHEDLALELLENAEYYLSSEMKALYSHHAHNGTFDTFIQLTGLSFNDMFTSPRGFALKGGHTPFVKKLIPAMLDYFETEKHIFVHGWIPCEEVHSPNFGKCYFYDPDWRKASANEWEKARWYNGMLCHNQGVLEEGKTIVCGHFHCSYGHTMYETNKNKHKAEEDFTPYYNDGIIALDACTVHSGFVNCVVIEDNPL